jgi:serine protease Do
VRIQTVTDRIAASLQLKKPRGALIASINEKGPAASTGLKARDVILTFDGRPVEEMKDLPRMVAETAIDKNVKLEVWRDGETVDLTVKIGELPEDVKTAKIMGTKDKPAVELLGMTLAELTDPLRRRFKLDSRAKGVLVLDVKEGSAGKRGGLRAGDLIVEVAPDTVSTPKELRERIDRARKSKRKTVLLLTERKKVRQFIVLPVI